MVAEIKKQAAIYVPISEHREFLEGEATRRKWSIGDLILYYMKHGGYRGPSAAKFAKPQTSDKS